MIRQALAAAAFLAAAPVAAQTQQETLDARYDRALAAGYKALFLCSAIANAERVGGTRTPESVIEWELKGIQEPLDAIVRGLPHRIARASDGQVGHVAVSWDDQASPRIARHEPDRGCHLLPLGHPEPATAQRERADGQFVITAEHPRNPPKVLEVARKALSKAYGAGSRTTVVSVDVNGRQAVQLFAEGFDHWTPQRTWSVAKSIAATLIGAAVQRGEVDVDASAGLGLADDDPRRAITIDNLLRMASGRYSDTPGNRTDPIYFGGATVDERATVWPLIHEPGTVFRYANNDTLMAVKAIAPTFAAHPPSELFAKLGMHATVAETDWQGNYILSSQVWSTAFDLANLGKLYLDDGVWNGERILPAGWVEYVSSPSGPQPEGPFGYGAGFWLLNRSEGVPPDTFAAMGNRGQYVVIVPSRDVVIVRRGEDPPGTRFDIAAFTRDVLTALD